MEKFIYISIGFIISCGAVVSFLFFKKRLQYYTQNLIRTEFTRVQIELEERQLKFFERIKSDLTQNNSKSIAKEPETVQNDSGLDTKPEPSLWNNKEKLKSLREQLQSGEISDYLDEPQLAELSPMEAWRKVDSRLAEFEEME